MWPNGAAPEAVPKHNVKIKLEIGKGEERVLDQSPRKIGSRMFEEMLQF